MNDWLCKECFELEDEALELHIQLHARQSVWSYDEVKAAVTSLREQYRHCVGCQDRIDRDLRRAPNPYHNPPGRAMDFNAVPTVQFRDSRGYGKKSTMELFEEIGRAWVQLTGEIRKVFDGLPPIAKQMRDAGLIPEEPPTDPKERALWLVKNRNTGPARPSAASARRPRRHK